MSNALVDRATSEMQIGPDWAMNLEICDMLNHEPGQAREFVKCLRKRIRSKNPRIQLLALTLLEVVVKNCGDMIHMIIAEKDIPRVMAKIAKKKPDFHVKEKILSLIFSWQEAFGGLQDKYPQFFIAYQDLLRAGMMFPKRAEMSTPIFQSRQPPSYPYSKRNYEIIARKTEGHVDSDITILSFSDIQSARGVLDVLVEMLDSLEPKNKEGVKQKKVIVELTEQCRLYRQRVVHLVNSTSDEELLRQGLALNDDLQNVLAKYDNLATGVSSKEPKKQKSLQALVDIDDLNNTNQDDNRESDRRSSASGSTSNQAPLQQLLLPAPSESHIDLLSGDDFGTVSVDSLALIPANETASDSLENEQNMLVISSAYSPRSGDSNNYLAGSELVYACGSQFQQQEQILPHMNESSSNHGGSVYEQDPSVQSSHAYPSWNNQFSLISGNMQHQGNTGELDQGGSLPPPPWETELSDSSQHDQAYDCQNAYLHSMPSSQVTSYNYGQQQDSQIYGHNTAYSYSNDTEISHRLYGLSMHNNAYKNAQQTPTSSSYLQLPMKHSKQEDNLFGDLVRMAKSNKSAN